MRRAELAVAAGWFALGAAIAVASWRMDRLDRQGIEPWSAPGLTPGAVGVLVMAFAVAVGWRAWRDSRPGAEGAGTPVADAAPSATATKSAEPVQPGTAPGRASDLGRTALVAALCLAFAATLGHGLPLIATGAAFVFAFTSIFSWAGWRRAGRTGRGLATALAVAVGSTLAISLLFERVFLVNLP